MSKPSTLSVLLLIAAVVGCGAKQADVINVDDDNPVMLKAIDDARASVDQFIAALQSPEPSQLGLSVKALFEEGDQGEHIWLTSVRYTNGQFTGEINNDPQSITTVKLGDKVTVSRDEISDWMFIENGKLVGGYTIRALIEITPPDERPEFPFLIE